VLLRAASHGLELQLPEAPEDLDSAAELGASLLALVARAQELGIDPEQAARVAVRGLEQQVRELEAGL
jgi:XTP/dITP diphosphohydrolase